MEMIHQETRMTSTHIFSVFPIKSSFPGSFFHFSRLILPRLPSRGNFVVLGMLYEERSDFPWVFLLHETDERRRCFSHVYPNKLHLFCQDWRMPIERWKELGDVNGISKDNLVIKINFPHGENWFYQIYLSTLSYNWLGFKLFHWKLSSCWVKIRARYGC